METSSSLPPTADLAFRMVEVSLGIREVWRGPLPPLCVQEVRLSCDVSRWLRLCVVTSYNMSPSERTTRWKNSGHLCPTQPGPALRPTALDPTLTPQSDRAAAHHEPVIPASGEACAADDGDGSEALGRVCLVLIVSCMFPVCPTCYQKNPCQVPLTFENLASQEDFFKEGLGALGAMIIPKHESGAQLQDRRLLQKALLTGKGKVWRI